MSMSVANTSTEHLDECMGHQATYIHTVEAQLMLVLFSLLCVTHQAFYEDYSAWRILPPDVITCLPLLLVMVEKPKTEVHTDNGLPPSVLSDWVSHSTHRDRTRASTLCFFKYIFFRIWTCKKPADYGPQQH